MKREISIFSDTETLSRNAAERWIELAREAITQRGAFHVAFAGGTTPKRTYQQLALTKYAGQVDWGSVHVYFGDERCVPPDSPDSNYHTAHEALLRHVPCPAGNIHRIVAEQANPQQAAREYANVLAAHLPDARQDFGRFDLILLGLGPDGHTASLFPDTQVLEIRDRAVSAVYVDKLRSWRITLTYPVIEHARHILVLAEGARKAQILRQIFQLPSATVYPIQRITPQGQMQWFLDEQAARYLEARP